MTIVLRFSLSPIEEIEVEVDERETDEAVHQSERNETVFQQSGRGRREREREEKGVVLH